MRRSLVGFTLLDASALDGALDACVPRTNWAANVAFVARASRGHGSSLRVQGGAAQPAQ